MITNKLTIKEINNRNCHIFRNGVENRKLPVFYWGIMPDNAKSIMAVISYLKKCTGDRNFLLVAYESENWNDDFSPWEAPPVFGTQSFGGGAGKTLKWLTDCCIPAIESDESEFIKGTEDISRFTVGYSLAGLFSLWAYFENDIFTGAVSCSGSLWYDGFAGYIRRNETALERNSRDCIYLSLGDKEEHTKNKQMSTVGDKTRAVHELIREKFEKRAGVPKCTLEWNKGGHFSEPEVRVAKGMSWVLTTCAL